MISGFNILSIKFVTVKLQLFLNNAKAKPEYEELEQRIKDLNAELQKVISIDNEEISSYMKTKKIRVKKPGDFFIFADSKLFIILSAFYNFCDPERSTRSRRPSEFLLVRSLPR